MKSKRFQNRVAEGIFTLPVCMLLAAVLWWWPSADFSWSNALGLLLCMVTSGVLFSADFHCKFIRVRSCLTNCYWLFAVAAMGFLHQGDAAMVATTAFSVSFFALFPAYQRPRDAGMAYNSFLFLALGSLAFPPLIGLSVCYWWFMHTYMRCMSVRTFFASLLGLMTPFWFVAGWWLWTGDAGLLASFAQGFRTLALPCWEWYATLPYSWILAWVLVAVLSLVAGIHYLRNCYDDNINVRMYLYMCLSQAVVFLVVLPFQMPFFRFLLPMTIVCSAPLVSHFFSLTKTRASSCFFATSLVLFILLAISTLWMPSYSFS